MTIEEVYIYQHAFVELSTDERERVIEEELLDIQYGDIVMTRETCAYYLTPPHSFPVHYFNVFYRVTKISNVYREYSGVFRQFYDGVVLVDIYCRSLGHCCAPPFKAFERGEEKYIPVGSIEKIIKCDLL